MADYNTITTYTGNGTTTDYAIPFEYSATSEVIVTVNGLTPSFTFVTDSLIRISPAPVSGANVLIRRSTDISEPAVTFVNGSPITAAQLNAGFRQSLRSAQEAFDQNGNAVFLATAQAEIAQTSAETATAQASAAAGSAETAQNILYFISSRDIDIRLYVGDSPELTGGPSYTALFQEAVNAAAAANACLVLQPWTYPIGTITLPSANVWWRSAGPGKPRLKLLNGVNNDLVKGTNVSNVLFDRIIFDGNKANNVRNADLVSNNGIHIIKGSGISHTDCEFVDCVENGERTIGVDGYVAIRPVYRANGHNGAFRSGHIDGTAFKNFRTWGEKAYDNATDGLNYEENIFAGQVDFPHAFNNGSNHSVYLGGTGILFYGGETAYSPRNIQVTCPKTENNYGGGLYVVSGADITIIGHESVNDGATGLTAETDFGHGFAAYTNGSGANGASQAVSGITYSKAKIIGSGKHGIMTRTSTVASRRLILDGPEIRNPGSLSSNLYDGISITGANLCDILDPVIEDTRGTKLMRRPISIGSGVTSPRLRYVPRNVTDGLTGGISNSVAGIQVESQFQTSQAFNMPTIAAGAVYFASITVTGVSTGDAVIASFNQGGNALAISAHVSAANTVIVTVHNRGGASFGAFSGTLSLTVIKQTI